MAHSSYNLQEISFQIGDEIIFECSAITKNQPRWQFNEDTGSSGIWANGVVEFIDNKVIQVSYTIKGFIGTGHTTWPNFDHDKYEPLQWYEEGYLQTVKKRRKKRCECGSEVTYGANATHAFYCPKYCK